MVLSVIGMLYVFPVRSSRTVRLSIGGFAGVGLPMTQVSMYEWEAMGGEVSSAVN